MAALSATLGYVAAYGLDFLFAGPLRNVELIASSVAVGDVYNRYALQCLDRNRVLPDKHPIRAMFI